MKSPPSEKDLIRRAALNYLARRDHSQLELAKKLRGNDYSEADISALITDLIQSGLVNDQRYAENYCHWRRAKGVGPIRISLELEARGISEETIAEVVQITDNAWFTEAQHLWRKRFKAIVPTDFKDRAKQMRFLQYRGYTREQIDYAVLGQRCEEDVV